MPDAHLGTTNFKTNALVSICQYGHQWSCIDSTSCFEGVLPPCWWTSSCCKDTPNTRGSPTVGVSGVVGSQQKPEILSLFGSQQLSSNQGSFWQHLLAVVTSQRLVAWIWLALNKPWACLCFETRDFPIDSKKVHAFEQALWMNAV